MPVRHYSRQSVGADEFMGSGRMVVLLSECARAVWGCIENMDPAGQVRFRCAIFRNEGAGRSSDLIVEAVDRTLVLWRGKYGSAPAVRLTTEIDPAKVRHKRDPGRCFRRAGWEYLHTTNGAAKGRADLVVLGAPLHDEVIV